MDVNKEGCNTEGATQLLLLQSISSTINLLTLFFVPAVFSDHKMTTTQKKISQTKATTGPHAVPVNYYS